MKAETFELYRTNTAVVSGSIVNDRLVQRWRTNGTRVIDGTRDLGAPSKQLIFLSTFKVIVFIL